MNARQFFDVWAEAVQAVQWARRSDSVPLSIGLRGVERVCASRHGDAIGAQARTYTQRLYDDARGHGTNVGRGP